MSNPNTDPVAILDDAHAALETFRGYIAAVEDESLREVMKRRMFEPLSRAVALLHLQQHIAEGTTEHHCVNCGDDHDVGVAGKPGTTHSLRSRS